MGVCACIDDVWSEAVVPRRGQPAGCQLQAVMLLAQPAEHRYIPTRYRSLTLSKFFPLGIPAASHWHAYDSYPAISHSMATL